MAPTSSGRTSHVGERGRAISLIESRDIALVEPVEQRKRSSAGIEYRDLGSVELIEHAIRRGEGRLAATGALVVETGQHTGRSPDDKFIVQHGALVDEIWWGSVNHPMTPEAFAILHGDVVAHLTSDDRYRVDLTVASDRSYCLPVRLVTESAWSALFAQNLFLPSSTDAESRSGWTILHAPRFLANPARHGTFTSTAIAIDFEWRRVIIAGTHYAGEIKKAMFTVLQGVLPALGVATMHCSANEGADGNSALFFGLSGTGKTTLSMDPSRRLIGDDEHGWTDRGIFNFEGGSYAKTIGLSAENEPEIYRAAQRFGSVLENVVLEAATRRPFFDDDSLTENTRAAFPLSFFDAAAGGAGRHPSQILFLTADAFGVLPPVARLTRDQALYWFLSGYTSKLAGTERGVTTPSATFSACFGSPFLPLPPTRYAALLAERLDRHVPAVWLVNTGWTGGPYGVGERMPIAQTRAIVRAILGGNLANGPFDPDSRYCFLIPRNVPGVPASLLRPQDAWSDREGYEALSKQLARDLVENFANFPEAPEAVRQAGPATA
jgi:phosphoenolpyruvate carboxykinase (ATP)